MGVFPSMNRAGVAAGVAAVLSVSTSVQAAAVFTSWGSMGGGENSWVATGSLGSVSVTYTSNANTFNPDVVTTDMSNSSVFSPPGSASQSVLRNQNGGGTLGAFLNTVTFSAGVNDLALYFRFWRGGDSTGTPVPTEYQLKAYDSGNNLLSYSFLSGDYTTAPTITNNAFNLGPATFTSGIIAFTGAVSRVEWNIADPNTGGGNGLTTFAILPSAVPGAGLAAVGSLGLAGVARRRRRH